MKSYLAKSRLVPLVLIFGMILLIFCGVPSLEPPCPGQPALW